MIAAGNLRTYPVTLIAYAAARIITQELDGKPSAVTLDPEGRAWVESPEEAAEVDVVGVYAGPSPRPLAEAIREDLLHELELRAAAGPLPWKSGRKPGKREKCA